LIPEYVATTYVVLTDNTHYYLGVEEFANGFKGYYLATVSDHVPIEEVHKVYNKIESLGFPISSSYAVKSKCETDKYIKKVKLVKDKWILKWSSSLCFAVVGLACGC